MSFIQRELQKLSRIILLNPVGAKEVYAAQQALSWALDPQAFKSPYAMLMGTQEGSEDCQACPDPLPS
jgi:hypothetical protein